MLHVARVLPPTRINVSLPDSKVPKQSNLDKGFLAACRPKDHGLENSSTATPQTSPSSQASATKVFACDEGWCHEITAELKQVAQVSSETASEVRKMMQQVGCLQDQFQQFTRQSVWKGNCHEDFEDIKSASLCAEVKQTLTGHLDDLDRHIEALLSRNMLLLQQQQQKQQQQRQFEQPWQAQQQQQEQSRDTLEYLAHSGPRLSEILAHDDLRPKFVHVTTVDASDHSNVLHGVHAWRTQCYARMIRPASLLLVCLDFAFLLGGLHATMDHLMQQRAGPLPPWILVGDVGFVSGFVLEVILRFWMTERWRQPFGRGASSLYFDAAVTAVSLLEVVFRISNPPLTFASLRFLRILRVVHLLRHLLSHHSKYFWELLLLMECMGESWRPLLSMVVVLFFLLLLWAMGLSQMIIASLTRDAGAGVLRDANIVRLYGSLGNTLFTLFLAITGGAEWGELLAPLEALSWWYRFGGSLFIASMRFSAPSIIAAVIYCFVTRYRDRLLQREAWMDQERDKQTIENLRRLFLSTKKEVRGRITEKTCRQVLQNEGATCLSALGVHFTPAMSLFQMMETDQHHRKDVEEFLFVLMNSKGDSTTRLAATMKHESGRILHKVEELLRLTEHSILTGVCEA